MRENYLDGTEVAPGYCRAVKHGNMIFIAGTGGVDENGELVGPDCESQTRAIYEKIEASLKHFGADLSHVVRLCIYITDMNDASAFAKVHAEVFADHLPTATLVGVTGLVNNMCVEIEAQAMLD